MRLLLCLGIIFFSQAAQPLQLNDAQQLLLQLRKKILLTVTNLPKHFCTETVERTTFLPRDSVVHPSCDDLVSRKRQKDPKRVIKYTADRLRLDVTIVGDSELFSWAGENRFEDKSLANLIGGGATSTGAFATLLGSIFANDSTTFTFNGPVQTNGVGLLEYGYQVPLNKSMYTIGNGETNATVAFDGTFSVDPSTYNLVTLNVRADRIPSQLRVCDDTTKLEYGVLSLQGSDFLLPEKVNWHIVNDDGTELENDTRVLRMQRIPRRVVPVVRRTEDRKRWSCTIAFPISQFSCRNEVQNCSCAAY